MTTPPVPTAAPPPTADAGKQRRRDPTRALIFATYLASLQQIARECGYALAVHGSMATDLDLIAVPWVPEAVSAEELIERLRASHEGGTFGTINSFDGRPESPEHKPHGRKAWSIYFDPACAGPYLDVSVMPRVGGLFGLVPGMTPVDPADLADYEEGMREAIPEMLEEAEMRQQLAADARRRGPLSTEAR